MANLPFPPTITSAPQDRSTRWLQKPGQGSGGIGVGIANKPNVDDRGQDYFQKYIDGVPCSALYFFSQHQPTFIGTSQILISQEQLNDDSFKYAGNIGPTDVSQDARMALQRLGWAIGEAMNPQGFFGVDFIQQKEQLWPVDFNPRITASAEIHVRALGLRIMDSYLNNQIRFEPAIQSMARPTRIVGKQVIYQAWTPEIAITESISDALFELAKQDSSRIGDIPPAGTVIHQAEPLVTVYAEGGSQAQVRHRLKCNLDYVAQLVAASW